MTFVEPRASKKAQEILILDQRRAYQINIMLGGMKHTYPEIRQAILRMDEEFMTLVQLSNLLKFVPDAEETGKLLEYKDAPEDVKLTLGRPEAFFVEMLKVERYQQRLEGLKFKVTFQGLLEGVNEVTKHRKIRVYCVCCSLWREKQLFIYILTRSFCRPNF